MLAMNFQPGDVVLFEGETYQVLETRGSRARVIPFPADMVAPLEVVWQTARDTPRRIGHAPLPAPTPCSTDDGCCPTNGNPVGEDEIAPPR